MAETMPFLEAVRNRRTYYGLDKNLPISDERVVEIVNEAIKHVPSSFNSQSARCVVLLKDEHDAFWDITKELLKPMVEDPEKWKGTEARINGFRAGYGSILFLEDPGPVSELQKAYPLYHEHFPQWSEHTSAMHQFALWCALEAEGCGANLQHYNPVVDQKAKQRWGIPQEWQLKAQLVFGGRVGGPSLQKTFKPLEERVFVHGK
ncbi:nitroreductase family protein [Lineolata rhizophorae]|uniref:Nitroreductase family protein n=1 Tax=Lineolata rhizophorae TaxID=578093 RepID=A0A6A6NQV8_9PEZI|nr:nitroreductase family protein [Lineolata rhizophorae]